MKSFCRSRFPHKLVNSFFNTKAGGRGGVGRALPRESVQLRNRARFGIDPVGLGRARLGSCSPGVSPHLRFYPAQISARVSGRLGVGAGTVALGAIDGGGAGGWGGLRGGESAFVVGLALD